MKPRTVAELSTRWMLTIPTDEGVVHVMADSEIEAEDVAMKVWLFCGEPPPVEGADIREVPATWECDGRDNSAVSA